MAKQLNVESGVKRGDVLFLMPQDVKVDASENGRFVHPDLTDLILKILTVPGGAAVLQPVEVRPIADKKVQLVAGYGRHGALTFINAHLTDGVLEKMLADAGYDDVQVPTEPLRLPCILKNINQAEAYIHNIIENRGRNATTAVDDAHNIRRLQEQYHKADSEICRIYARNGKPMSPAWLSQTLKLLQLDAETQQKVATTEYAASVGIFAAELPEETREQVLTLAKESAVQAAGGDLNAKVTHSDVVKAARKAKALPKPVTRKMTDVNALIERNMGPAEPLHKRRFFEALAKWIADEIDDDAMDKECSRRFKE